MFNLMYYFLNSLSLPPSLPHSFTPLPCRYNSHYLKYSVILTSYIHFSLPLGILLWFPFSFFLPLLFLLLPILDWHSHPPSLSYLSLPLTFSIFWLTSHFLSISCNLPAFLLSHPPSSTFFCSFSASCSFSFFDWCVRGVFLWAPSLLVLQLHFLVSYLYTHFTPVVWVYLCPCVFVFVWVCVCVCVCVFARLHLFFFFLSLFPGWGCLWVVGCLLERESFHFIFVCQFMFLASQISGRLFTCPTHANLNDW